MRGPSAPLPRCTGLHAEHHSSDHASELGIVPGTLLAVIQDLGGGLELVALRTESDG